MHLLLLTFSLDAGAAGVWEKKPRHVPLWLAQSPFVPDFFILKAAAFHRTGRVKPSAPFAELAGNSCGRSGDVTAWIAHKLGPKEVLTPEAGKRFGAGVKSLLNGTCFAAVELDVEPMPEPPPWLEGFVTPVRAALAPAISVRLAIPAVTARGLPPPALSWKPEAALAVLSYVDGLDLMLYDSAPATPADYALLVRDALDFAASAVKRFPGKRIVLGFPAYTGGNPKLHPVAIESLAGVRSALRDTPRDKAKVVCDPAIRMAYYPDEGRFNAEHKHVAREIEAWKTDVCR